MAIFRQIHTSFWNDVKVQEEFTPEDKYFFLYLLTNPQTKQIGVYQITKKQMAFETGYSHETIKALIQRFEDYHKLIKYDTETRELVIFNWGKYNLKKAGKPVEDLIKKELKEVKNISLLIPICKHIEQKSIRTLVETYIHESYNDTSTNRSANRGQEEEQEEQEEEQEEQQEQESSFSKNDIPKSIPYQEILDYLNEKADKNFNPKAESHKKLIRARWNEGYTVENFKTVINNKVSQWLGKFDKEGKPLEQYLRPSTLFSLSHFDNYLNETVSKPKSNQQQYGNHIDIPGFKGNMPF
ncbi:conserved phage C-terminal domain-containing protein [Bacillus thuringiensis]|nr:conserved phage C-terminal domain-containing protein [Bacillus thuringiensis]MED2755541.1 conserved phage C-terminal domain-containing protein [Bacillus thuringiensis]MED2769778.1 conserved phage C-terminal domain-containing protein [Bacillus thuringiensis]MED2773439.1 conserved phage C-terminal domain-containing protein [Bacillus thuringiensis]MED2782723.1 conserved phage C-terminal domain-containing protein [Bacillus thuringiensis]